MKAEPTLPCGHPEVASDRTAALAWYGTGTATCEEAEMQLLLSYLAAQSGQCAARLRIGAEMSRQSAVLHVT